MKRGGLKFKNVPLHKGWIPFGPWLGSRTPTILTPPGLVTWLDFSATNLSPRICWQGQIGSHTGLSLPSPHSSTFSPRLRKLPVQNPALLSP